MSKTEQKKKTRTQMRQRGQIEEVKKDEKILDFKPNKVAFINARKTLKDGSISNKDKHKLRMAYQVALKFAGKIAKYFSRPAKLRDISYGKRLFRQYENSYDELLKLV